LKRVTVFPAAIPRSLDILNTNKYTMIALAAICQDVLGTATVATGFGCSATAPASMSVSIAPGNIYALDNVDSTPYSSIAADTTHQILKQGVSLDAITLACAPPGTAGQSINYLIQATFQDVDTDSLVLPYYNANIPSQPYSGPGNNGAANYTSRTGKAVLAAKAATAAATGSQTTPAPDSGYIGLWVVTVAYGATTIPAGNISAYSASPLLNASLLAMIQGKAALAGSTAQQFAVAPATSPTQAAQLIQVIGLIGDSRNLVGDVNAAGTQCVFTADQIIVGSSVGGMLGVVSNFNSTFTLSASGLNGMDNGVVPSSAYVAMYAVKNPVTGASGILGTALAAGAIAPVVYGGSSPVVGYTQSALIAVIRAASSLLTSTSVMGKTHTISGAALFGTVTPASSVTAGTLNSSVLPANAKRIRGNISIGISTSGAAANFTVYSTANSTGGKVASDNASANSVTPSWPFDLAVRSPNSFWYAMSVSSGVCNAGISCSEYDIYA